MEFLKARRYQLVDPEVIGLPSACNRDARSIETSAEPLADALIAGDDGRCRQILVDLYLAEHSVSSICDEALARAFEQIGLRWSCGEAEIYQERRACEIVLRILHELRSLVNPAPPGAPLAIGATPDGDHYVLATTMAELVLQEAGWNARSLGNNIPLATLRNALRTQQPQLFWLSCSHLDQSGDFLHSYQSLHQEFGDRVAFVVGGRALTESLRQQMSCKAFCSRMGELEAAATQVLSTTLPNHH
jgi:methanogenic corrinoid protein MtbC1